MATISDVAADPARPGSRLRDEIGPGIRSWHLRASRDSAGKPPVRTPRHFLIHRLDGDTVVVGRVLHGAMDIPPHVDDEAFGQ